METRPLSDSDFAVGEWLVRPSLARIERGAEAIHVTPRSMAVLIYLAEAGGRVVSRNDILNAVWPRMAVTQDALSQCIVELRKAFRDDSKRPAVIETIPKVGVRLIAPVAVAPNPAIEPHEPASAAVSNDTTQQPVSTRGAGRSRWRTLLHAVQPLLSPAAAGLAFVTVAALGTATFWFADRSERSWQDPLAGSQVSWITDFIGAEEQAAISRDGRFVAFVSDRDGTWDVWVSQIGSAQFRNLTNGRVPNLRNPAVRMLAFSPEGADVLFWTKTTDATGNIVDHGWRVPVVGGNLRRDSAGIAELDWSRDGEWIVYHPSAPGDPLFIAGFDERTGGRQIYAAPSGIHCHFPLWSHDGQSIYFVQGFVPDEMDVWRIGASGGSPQQLTFHNSRVSFPVLLDDRTLLYLATAADGSGPWLHALDLERFGSRRVNTGSSVYTSIAASEEGRRIVATEAHSVADLWRIAVNDRPSQVIDAARIELRTPRAVSPRFGPGFIVYRAQTAGTDGLWKLEGDTDAVELWNGVGRRIVAGPALTLDGQRIAFTIHRRGLTQLYVINADGSGARRLAEELEIRGAPAWSPDGDWIAITALRDQEPRLFKIPIAGNGPPISLGDEYALEPVWSPSGAFLLYTGRDVGTTFEIKAVNADGTPHPLPTIFLQRGSRRLDFLGPDDDQLVVLKGTLSHKEFWVVDLRSGTERPLTDLGPGPVIDDFDVSADGRTIIFDRAREESDIVRIDLAG